MRWQAFVEVESQNAEKRHGMAEQTRRKRMIKQQDTAQRYEERW